jgi:hypothetical protein
MKEATKVLFGSALALALAAVCPTLGHAAERAAEPQQATPDQVQDGQPFDVKTEVIGECKAGSECVAKITVSAKGEFHVNESYPFKFTAAADKVEFHGSGGNVFAAGDFERQGKTVGVMTVKFKPAEKGPGTITGKYKICICSDKICSPQVIDVSIAFNAK